MNKRETCFEGEKTMNNNNYQSLPTGMVEFEGNRQNVDSECKIQSFSYFYLWFDVVQPCFTKLFMLFWWYLVKACFVILNVFGIISTSKSNANGIC